MILGHTYDKFYGTPLDLALRSRDIRDLIITGVVTDVCVNCTVLSAANRDYHVTAVTDGVATLWPELQDACFAIWRRKFARLRTTDEVIEEIRSTYRGASTLSLRVSVRSGAGTALPEDGTEFIRAHDRLQAQ